MFFAPARCDDVAELLEVDVAFERVLASGVVRFVDDDVGEGAARELLMRAGGGEVHVARDGVAGLDEDAGDEVLGAASLVGRDDVLEAVELLDGRFEVDRTIARRRTPRRRSSSPAHCRSLIAEVPLSVRRSM